MTIALAIVFACILAWASYLTGARKAQTARDALQSVNQDLATQLAQSRAYAEGLNTRLAESGTVQDLIEALAQQEVAARRLSSQVRAVLEHVDDSALIISVTSTLKSQLAPVSQQTAAVRQLSHRIQHVLEERPVSAEPVISEGMTHALRSQLAPLSQQAAAVYQLSRQVQESIKALPRVDEAALFNRFRHTLKTHLEPLSRQMSTLDRLANLVQSLQTTQDKAYAEKLELILARLGAYLDKENNDQVVSKATAPAPEQERAARNLSGIQAGSSRSDLNDLLDAIARRGRFDAVLISDESGLLLATSADAEETEGRAGASATLITVARYLVRVGEPEPLAFLLHDQANRMALSRMFTVDNTPYLLTAVSTGQAVGTHVLDPILEQVTGLMQDWTKQENKTLAKVSSNMVSAPSGAKKRSSDVSD